MSRNSDKQRGAARRGDILVILAVQYRGRRVITVSSTMSLENARITLSK